MNSRQRFFAFLLAVWAVGALVTQMRLTQAGGPPLQVAGVDVYFMVFFVVMIVTPGRSK